jgi:LysM repeat protein
LKTSTRRSCANWKPRQVAAALILMVLAAGCWGGEPAAAPTAAPTSPPTLAAPQQGAAVEAATPAPAGTAPAAPEQTPTPTGEAAAAASLTRSVEETATLTATSALTSTATPCSPPAGWFNYTIAEGDTLSVLAGASGAAIADLMRANCLTSEIIIAGHTILLPVDLVRTPTPCAKPLDWVIYPVRANDTLSMLAALTGTSVEDIQRANCLEDTMIVVGQLLFLPSTPPRPVAAPGADAPALALNALPAPAAAVEPQPVAGDTEASGQGIGGGDTGDAGTGGGGTGRTVFASPFGQLTDVFGPDMQPGDPGEDDSCSLDSRTGFRVAAHVGRTEFEVGERPYFYACDPIASDNLEISAVVSVAGTNESWPVQVFPSAPRSDIAARNPHWTAVWNAVPSYKPGLPYQITMSDNAGNVTPPLTFTLAAPTVPHIITVPPVGAAGQTSFEIYLVGFPNGPQQVDIRASDDPLNCVEPEPRARKPITVWVDRTTNGIAWGRYQFVSQATDPPGCYALRDAGENAEDFVILVP